MFSFFGIATILQPTELLSKVLEYLLLIACHLQCATFVRSAQLIFEKSRKGRREGESNADILSIHTILKGN